MKMRGWVWLNGRLVATARARISVYDRGLLYGDGLFETVRVYRGKVYALPEHLARLRRAAGILAISLPAVPWPSAIEKLLARNGLGNGDGWVRITLTRGPSERGLLPSSNCRPTLLISCGHLDPRLAVQQQRGIAAMLLPFARHPLLAELKSANYLDGVLAKVAANRRRCSEALFVAADGTVREATTANLFVMHGDVLATPLPVGILRGITRETVLRLASAHGWPVRERAIRVEELSDADEIFLTSSLAEVLPVVSLNGRRVGRGRVGTYTRQMQRLYQAEVAQVD